MNARDEQLPPMEATNLPDALDLSPEKIAQLRHAVKEVREWLELKLVSGRYSFGFVIELAQHIVGRGYNTFTIYEEIGRLEGSDSRPSMTKPAAPFRGKVLRGLWHKHHHQARFILRNMIIENSRPGAIEEIMAPYYGQQMSDVVGQITHAMTVGAYESRARERRMTGEWIVYEPSASGNYYLTLASHTETDEDVRARVEDYREVDIRLADHSTHFTRLAQGGDKKAP